MLRFLLLMNLFYCLNFVYAQNQRYTNISQALKDAEKVKFLDLSDQGLTELDEKIAQLKNLEKLDLSLNKFNEIPSVVFKLTNLKELYFRGANNYIEKYEKDNLIDKIPVEIGKLKRLEILDLSYHEISKLPIELGTLMQLKKLDLFHNNITSKEVEIIASLHKLKALDIGANELEILPKGFSNLKRLDTLKVDNTWSEGVPVGTNLKEFPEVVCEMKNLKVLSLSGHFLEKIPTDISGLTSLRELYLYCNKFTALPDEITQLKKLEILNVDIYCVGELEGYCEKPFNLPKGICKLKRLISLEMNLRNVSDQEKKRIKTCLPRLKKL